MKWKFGKITPRLKSKDLSKLLTSSYRPVAALPTTWKLVERTAQKQLLNFMESMGQLYVSNHAYRKDFSTTITLIDILDELYQNTEERKITALMAIDQSIAFDCVNHEMLIDSIG